MASFHAKASKKVEELDEGAEVEDPACVVPPVGGSSCEEWSTAMARTGYSFREGQPHQENYFEWMVRHSSWCMRLNNGL